ncbi:MAG: hypothetical protein ABSA72_00120 [Nitrososphaerales archaeon]|jgi:hypothetical protein
MSAPQPKTDHDLYVEKALLLQTQELQQIQDLLRTVIRELQSINMAVVNRV